LPSYLHGKKVRVNFDRKWDLQHFGRIFFINSSGHPAHRAQERKPSLSVPALTGRLYEIAGVEESSRKSISFDP
jgi:hypothetical protein